MFRHYLWSPSRKSYVRGHHKINGCLFCKIVEDSPEVPKKVIFRGRKFVVIMNIFPYSPGHLEIIPVRHVESIEELNKDEYKELWDYVKKGIMLLKAVLRPDGFNVGINLGGDISGASIAHLHIHIVPRYKSNPPITDIEKIYKLMIKRIDEKGF
ncbi:MAG: HIT family hydrolase [Candidatus Aenigmatarchaeota archaeon]|nr:MAG: HIT family hydrolase [Candidatus Aenigmarchaeota archaeon]